MGRRILWVILPTVTQSNPDDYITSVSLTFNPGTPPGLVTAVLNDTNLPFLGSTVTVTFTPTVANSIVTWACQYTGSTANQILTSADQFALAILMIVNLIWLVAHLEIDVPLSLSKYVSH